MFKKLMQSFDRMLGRGVIDEHLYEELEEALLEADANVHVAAEILASNSPLAGRAEGWH